MFVVGLCIAFGIGIAAGFGACLWIMADEPDMISEDD